MAIAALALSGLWRRPTPSRIALSTAHSQGKPKSQRSNNTYKGEQTPRLRAKLSTEDSNSSRIRTRRGREPRTRKKWHEKPLDAEFDMVIVPSDGISMSGSDSDESDWSVGWFEPHSKNFTDDEEESFAVLMPCYGSPSPEPISSRGSSLKEEPKPPAWTSMLANLARQSSNDHKNSLERWLAGL